MVCILAQNNKVHYEEIRTNIPPTVLPTSESVDRRKNDILVVIVSVRVITVESSESEDFAASSHQSRILEPATCGFPDGHGYELVSSVRALVPQKFSVEEELMHVKHVEVKSPHVGVMWKFGRGVISSVIGSDLLEQASITFTKEGVKFNKYENHAQLMQISAENLQEELDLRHVENRQMKKELEKLIQDYKPEKTASTDVTMRIILKDEEPVCQHPRRLAFTERQEVNKQIEEWLNEGIIRPNSSEYASPIVMVKNKDGYSRMCIDYRKLNQKLVKNKFLLPLIEDVLDTLQETKVYSTLDLRNGFFHVNVDED
ncbi:retrovirus-related Pol polyprotein from transposon 412 [Trichonephila clavipes]|nr:retrovirus-related Pol polyprotein from transposon 412 [Trichonephila clavipes]